MSPYSMVIVRLNDYPFWKGEDLKMVSTLEPGIDALEKETDENGTNKCQDLETATNEVLQRIAAEPAYRIALYKILEYCETARPGSDIERTVPSFPEMKGAMHSPQVLLSWLEDAGGIEHLAEEAGEEMWQTTPAGRNVVRMDSFDNRLRRLFTQESDYQELYFQLLRACLSPKSRAEIESMFKGNPILQKFKVYPAFLIETLEEAGGLEWDNKWKTTSAGKDFLNAQVKIQT